MISLRRKEITLSQQTSTLHHAAPKPIFPFQVGEPVDHRGVVLAPLFSLRDPVARYVTLDEALARGLEITEIGPEGAVTELAVSNPLDEAVLLYDGEELAGAKQNRILDVSVLAAPRSKLVVSVSCVERGRWRAVSRTFSSAGHVAHIELRRSKARALGIEPLARGGAQRAVWDSVDRRLEALEVTRPHARTATRSGHTAGGSTTSPRVSRRCRASAVPCSRSETRSASTRCPGRMCSRSSGRSCATAIYSTRSIGSTTRRPTPSTRFASSTRCAELR